MTHEIKVLDHGFVRLRNLAGPTNRMSGDADRAFCADDTDVANAARMSFNQTDSNRSYEMEMKLNKYLLENRHMTPFESIEVWLEMKLPIFVARQFVRHRTAALNEVSGRYVTLPEEWYIPKIVGGKPINKKQGQSDTLEEGVQRAFREVLDDTCKKSYEQYLGFMELGVAPEHARMFLHVNHYTHWLWKQDLRNLFGFLCLRQHSHAQIEARQYADAIVALLEPHIPGLMALYNDIMRVPE